MNASLKVMIGSAVMLAAGTLAAQTIELNKAADWMKNPAIIEKDGMLTVGKQVMFISAKTFDIDPGKTYTLKLSVKDNLTGKDSKDKPWVLFGFSVTNDKGVAISPPNVNIVAGTETVLAADAKKGTKTIQVKDASKWKTASYYYVCANAKADLSDLPNSTFAGVGIAKVEKKGEAWEITLVNAVPADFKEGTALRIHAGGGYLYTGGNLYADNNWKVMTGSIKGMSKSGWANNIWPKSTAKARVIILADWNNKKAELQFKDLSLTVK